MTTGVNKYTRKRVLLSLLKEGPATAREIYQRAREKGINMIHLCDRASKKTEDGIIRVIGYTLAQFPEVGVSETNCRVYYLREDT